ncbi:HTH domain-containing protein [Halorubellus sp. JP-L1]|uniref:nucleotidyltransferase domain-containing protein n=1 Tax=Halorubellus sp. JP-L1 TaxID=2715753 RepID=UPI00140DB145|nr:nucleotidyltransferase domain-containing protein [Halorubellus sp. JP-L1]NHN42858.1 HTH domain-containing protein [Halorubellus sp. JP-L1]
MGRGISICVDVPSPSDGTVFRIEAADEILRVLADAHESEFTIPELVDATDVSRSTVWRAVELLESISAVRVRETPQRNYVSIHPERLQKDDPVFAIEQPEFRPPTREFVDRVTNALETTDEVEDLVGVLVFGSVARGEADRRSDIDLFVVVRGDRTTARRTVTEVVTDLEAERFDGERFEFEPYVETTESATRARSKLREIFEEGIAVHGSGELTALRTEVFADE